MKLLSINTEVYEDTINILWYLSKRCNYDCFYCKDGLHDSSSPLLDMQSFNVAVKNIQQSPLKKIKISISGGEPYLHPNFTEMLEMLKEVPKKHVEVGVTSNGSLKKNSYLNSLKWLDFLTISAHLHLIQNPTFINKLNSLQKNTPFPIGVHIMLTPGHLNQARELFSQLKLIGAQPIIRRVRAKESRDSLKYSKEEEEFIKQCYDKFSESTLLPITYESKDQKIEHSLVGINEITAKNLNYFKGWSCDAGKQNLTIFNDGFAYSCEAGLYTGTSLGYFYKPNFNWETALNLICPIARCVCVTDIKIPKRKLAASKSNTFS